LESAVAHARSDIQNIRFIELQERFTKIIAEGREKQKQFIRYMIQMFRNILLVNSNKTELLRATTKEKNILSTFTPYIKLRNISPITEACNKAILYIERNGNSSLIFNNLYFNIANRLQVR
jgi:DNA polymerase-3 subunit delta'